MPYLYIDTFKAYPWIRAQLRSCKNYEPETSICLIKDIRMKNFLTRQGTILKIEEVKNSKIVVQNSILEGKLILSPRQFGDQW